MLALLASGGARVFWARSAVPGPSWSETTSSLEPSATTSSPSSKNLLHKLRDGERRDNNTAVCSDLSVLLCTLGATVGLEVNLSCGCAYNRYVCVQVDQPSQSVCKYYVSN